MQIGDPTPLTEKELFYLRDQMSWELVAAKKAYQYAHQTSDPECQNLMFMVAEQHQRNLERVLQHLQQHMQKVSVSGMQQGGGGS